LKISEARSLPFAGSALFGKVSGVVLNPGPWEIKAVKIN